MDRLRAMQLFVRLAETGSFSKAARSVGVGQPTSSKKTNLLEKHLETQLVQRTSRGLSISDDGRIYYEHALRLLGDSRAQRRLVNLL